ncbi:VOC family protein [Lysobacter sp. TAF61]|uniref:VOC family protein n=1 Tax=Lysobacter sp. TAF61 TaxID=3233072 RepID=UPI003F96D4E8
MACIVHVAITVEDLEATTAFYERLFGAAVTAEHAVDGRTLVRQLSLGGASLSVHQKDNGVELVAARPTPGSADICFRWRGTMDEALSAPGWSMRFAGNSGRRLSPCFNKRGGAF